MNGADESSKPADSGRVGDEVVELAVRIHDREEAAQKGEPDPWAEEFPAPYRSERMTAMRLAITAALAAQGQGDRLPAELDAWLQERGLVPDLGEDGSFDMSDMIVALNDHENALMASRPAPPASPAGVPDGWVFNVTDDAQDNNTWLEIKTPAGTSAGLRVIAQTDAGETIASQVLHQLRDAMLAAPSAPEGDGREE